MYFPKDSLQAVFPNSAQSIQYIDHEHDLLQCNRRHLEHGLYVVFANAVQNKLCLFVLPPSHFVQPLKRIDVIRQIHVHHSHLN